MKRFMVLALVFARATAPAPAAAPRPPPATEAQIVAASDGRLLIETAVAAGRWRAADARSLGALLPRMSDEHREQTLAALVQALSARRLVPEGPRLPL